MAPFPSSPGDATASQGQDPALTNAGETGLSTSSEFASADDLIEALAGIGLTCDSPHALKKLDLGIDGMEGKYCAYGPDVFSEVDVYTTKQAKVEARALGGSPLGWVQGDMWDVKCMSSETCAPLHATFGDDVQVSG